VVKIRRRVRHKFCAAANSNNRSKNRPNLSFIRLSFLRTSHADKKEKVGNTCSYTCKKWLSVLWLNVLHSGKKGCIREFVRPSIYSS